MHRTLSASLIALFHPLALALALALGLLAAPAAAQPKIPPPTLKGVLADNMVSKARIRWSRTEGDEHSEVTIWTGMAELRSTKWSPDPVRLKFDIEQNQRLERAIKQARLGPPAQRAPGPEDRTLEVLGHGPDGWVVVGSWTMPRARWQKQQPAIYKMLEPLFDVPADAAPASPRGPKR